MQNFNLPELMQLSALEKGRQYYLDAPDEQIAFEVPENTVHPPLEIKSTGKISVPIKTVKKLYFLVADDADLSAKVRSYKKKLKEDIANKAPPPEPEDDPRFEIYEEFAKLLNADIIRYPASAIFESLCILVMNMIREA